MTPETILAIKGCLRAFRNGYTEAQGTGLDSNAAFECAIDEVEELLKNKCECDYTEPYGFVPEAGCPVHDSYDEI